MTKNMNKPGEQWKSGMMTREITNDEQLIAAYSISEDSVVNYIHEDERSQNQTRNAADFNELAWENGIHTHRDM